MTGLVYALAPVGEPGPIKIGHSRAPADRLATYCAWSPVPLDLRASVPGSLTDERAAHWHLVDDHSHHEWFNASPTATALVEGMARGEPIAALVPATAYAAKGWPFGREAKTPRWSAEQRERKSLQHRLYHADRKVRQATNNTRHVPLEIDRNDALTDDLRARVAAIADDPMAHSERAPWVGYLTPDPARIEFPDGEHASVEEAA